MNNMTPVIKDSIPDIVATWREHKQKRIKVSPNNTLRASSIGHPCDRYHYHSIKNWRDKALHDVVLQSIFDEGFLHEKETLIELQEMGFKITQQQRSFQIDKPLITGHIDGIIEWKGQEFPFDIKSIAPYDFKAINSAEDLLFSKKTHQRKYPAQLQIYLLQCGAELGCFILKNKLTGEIKPIWMQIDYDYTESILKRAERVYSAIQSENPPNRINDFTVCNSCEFKSICLPELTNAPAVLCLDDPELQEKLEHHEKLKPIATEFNDLDDELKEQFKSLGTGQSTCGNFIIKTTEVISTKKIPITFTETKTSYLKTQIVRMKG